MRTPAHLLPVQKTIPFDIHRRVIAHMTGNAWQQIPHVAFLYEPDVTELMNVFSEVRDIIRTKENVNVTVTALMLKIITEGLKASPELNAHISYNTRRDTGELRIMDTINIALPWMLPNGMMITPVIHNVEKKSLKEIAEGLELIANKISNTDVGEMLYQAAVHDTIHDLSHFKLSSLIKIFSATFGSSRISRMSRKQRRRYYATPESMRLVPDDIASGTVLVSNVGSLYPQARGAITLLEIIPPQVFVIALNPVQKKPAVFTDSSGAEQIGIRKILPITLAFDHRAVDFGTVTPFQKKIDEICNHPDILRNWI